MLVGIRRKHWVLVSVSVTCVLLLLVLGSKPPQSLLNTQPAANDNEIGFLSRRIANDERSGGEVDPSTPSVSLDLLKSQQETQEPQSLVQPHDPHTRVSTPSSQPSPSSPPTPMPKLNKDQRVALAKQGVLMVQYDDEGDLSAPPEYTKDKDKEKNKKDQENWQKEQSEIQKQHLIEEKQIQDQSIQQEEQTEIKKQLDKNIIKQNDYKKLNNNDQYTNYAVDNPQVNKVIVEPEIQNRKSQQSQSQSEPIQTFQQFERGKDLIHKSKILQIQPKLEQIETGEYGLKQTIKNEDLPQYLQIDPHMKQVLTEEQIQQLDAEVQQQLYLNEAQNLEAQNLEAQNLEAQNLEAQNLEAQSVQQNRNVYHPQYVYEDQQLHQQMVQHQIMQQKLQQQLEQHKLDQQIHYQHQLQQQDNLHRQLQARDQHLPPIEGAVPLHQSASVSVVSRTSQVSESKGGTVKRVKPHVPPQPVKSYTELKDMAERLLLSSLKREFHGGPWDVRFTPGLPVPKTRVRRVLILSTWRSGSTFLGDLLKSYPGTFYIFEPLHQLLKNQHLEEGPQVDTVRKILRDIMTCNFHEQEGYVNYLRNNTFLIEHNSRYWRSCIKNRAMCFDKTFLSKSCEYMPVNVMKTVRMGLSPVVQLLEDPTLDLRVIQLVRDPRGALHSRMKLSWCKSDACSDPETVCNDLLTDLSLSTQVKEKFPDRYLLVRYEDVGAEPELMAQEIFKFLGLTYHKNVERFVNDHTSLNTTNTKRKKKVGAYTTYRDSKATAFAWRDALNFTTVNDIQNACMEPLRLLGLRTFDTEEKYKDKSLPVLLDDDIVDL